MITKLPIKAAGRALWFVSVLAVSACATPFPGDRNGPEHADTKPTANIKDYVSQAQQALAQNELAGASRLLNAALKLDITNAQLQFLNSYTYHRMGAKGDSTKLDLAEQGLKLALKFDPGYLAARYQLGRLYMDQRRYRLAQGHFAAVALHRPEDPDVLYDLAASSYYARDPRTADAALSRLVAVDPLAASSRRVVGARVMTKAALNDAEAAVTLLKGYQSNWPDHSSAQTLSHRVRSWSGFYQHDAKVILAQVNPFTTDPNDPYALPGQNPFATQQPDPYAPGSTGGFAPGGAQAGQPSGVGYDGTEPQMVVVDVVLIGTQEDLRESRGINLLSGLQLQFGDPLTGAPGASLSSNRISDNLDSGLAEHTQTITRSISIPAVTYSLNIANSADANNEILAKPSLVAQSGQTSEFFSGTEILAAAVSGGDGDSVSVQKEVGVKLAVTPEALDEDLLRLHVVAERTFLTDPSNSVVFEFRLDTTKTNVNATVTMRYGETLILGGLSERETSRSSDGVPGLMDVPGLNLLFSERTERNFERSILVLMTPRRPQYTRRAKEQREETQSRLNEVEREIERLERRHEDWFTPRPTFMEIRDALKHRDFFEEFRQGDVEIKSWLESDDVQQTALRFQN